MAHLKDFTQSDWDAFSGCESSHPLMTEVVVTFENDATVQEWETIVVVDLKQLHLYCYYGDEEAHIFKEFPGFSSSIYYAQGLEDKVDFMKLMEDGFTVA